MREVLPGVWHWITPNPSIGGTMVSSYWLDTDGVLIDPLVPGNDGIEWFARRPTAPAQIVLSNRHHYRDSSAFHERFGVTVLAPQTGMHAFTGDQPVSGYAFGDELPGGLTAIEIGQLSPDDGGLYRPSSRALWLADTVVRSTDDEASKIGWVPDGLMDEPDETKRALVEVFRRVLDELEFEHLLLAHGLPIVGGGRAALEQLVLSGGQTAPDAF